MSKHPSLQLRYNPRATRTMPGLPNGVVLPVVRATCLPGGTQSDNAAEGLLPNLDLSNLLLVPLTNCARSRQQLCPCAKEPWRQAKCPRQLKSHRKNRNGKGSDRVRICSLVLHIHAASCGATDDWREKWLNARYLRVCNGIIGKRVPMRLPGCWHPVPILTRSANRNGNRSAFAASQHV